MAEHLGRYYYPKIQFRSAGFHKQDQEEARWAVDTLRIHYRIDASSHVPEDLTSLIVDQADDVIVFDDKEEWRENRDNFVKKFAREPISELLFDPFGTNDIERYHLCCRAIMKILKRHFGKPLRESLAPSGH
jgi:protein-tyrosine-phosphatase